MIKSFFFLSIIIFFTFNTSIAENKDNNIVFIDLNFIFVNSLAGKDWNTQINKKDTDFKKKVNEFQKNIDTKKKKLLSQKNVLEEGEYKKKLVNLENEVKKINLSISDERKQLSLLKSKGEKEFFLNLNLIIEKYSIDNSIDIILKKRDLVMGKNDLDVTKEIFDLFNEKIEKLTIK
tara:strand:+ start:94 stop:624 length:531 start_codon:yes stop_codon:yes gene_type:complete